MGASSVEIERQIRETRGRLDEELRVLEQRAAASARRFGRVAAGVGVGLGAVVVGVMVYRRYRQRERVKGLHRALLQSFRDLPEELTSRLKRRLPLKVVVTDRAQEESASGAWAGVARKVAPTIVGSAAAAIASRIANRAPRDRPAPPVTSASD